MCFLCRRALRSFEFEVAMIARVEWDCEGLMYEVSWAGGRSVGWECEWEWEWEWWCGCGGVGICLMRLQIERWHPVHG